MNLPDDVFLDYDLPAERIAQTPSRQRGSSRLLVVNRASGELFDTVFSRFPGFLRAGEVLVLNDTRVVPARVPARKAGGGGRVELLFLEWSGPRWRGLVKGKLRPGSLLEVDGWPTPLAVAASRGGEVEIEAPSPDDPLAFFRRAGHPPLPPYIRRGAADAGLEETDRMRYQTVFAERDGSVAAPTAGLHFTPALLAEVEGRGVTVVQVTLHVGWGTFSPIRGDWREHRLHPEWGSVTAAAAAAVNQALAEGRRVTAVGTTSTRLLESHWRPGAGVVPGEGPVDLYIAPGYAFNVPGALLTNFHRPRSSLLLLVDAFAGSGAMRRAYAEAVRLGYSFFSYGDAMLIL